LCHKERRTQWELEDIRREFGGSWSRDYKLSQKCCEWWKRLAPEDKAFFSKLAELKLRPPKLHL